MSTGGSIAFGIVRPLDPRCHPWAPYVTVICVAVVLGGLAIATVNQVVAKRIAREAESKRARSRTDYSHQFARIVDMLPELRDSKLSDESLTKFFRSTMRDASLLFAHEHTRVNVYEFDSSEEQEEGGSAQKPPSLLVLKGNGGRSDDPRAKFSSDDPHGADLIERARGHNIICVSDPELAEFEIDWTPDSPWKSFMIVPLRDGSRALGVMLVDTPDRVSFTVEDRATAHLVAKIVTFAFGAVKAQSRSAGPELANAENRITALRAQRAARIAALESAKERGDSDV